jgi:hypothetical protein
MGILGGVLSQLFDRLQGLIQQFQNAGLILEVNAGAQIETVVSQAQSSLSNLLNTAVSDLSAQQQQMASSLTAVVDDLQNKIIDNLTTKLQTIANTLPFAKDFPQLAAFGGNIVAPNVAGDIRFTVDGNFMDIGQDGYDATISIGSATIKNATKTTNHIAFTVPRNTFTFVPDSVTYLPTVIKIPYRKSEVLGLIHKEEFATFNVIFIILPTAPGTYDLQTSKSGTVPQQVGDSCSNLVWDSSSDDDDSVKGCNMVADWVCLRETVSYHFTRQEGDQGDAWLDLGNASTTTFVGWHFKTEHHRFGTSGKLTVTLNYQKTRNVPQTQTTDTGNLALAWGDAKIVTFDPAASWKITFHQFDGVTKEYDSDDSTNPYIKIVAIGNQISIKALPF